MLAFQACEVEGNSYPPQMSNPEHTRAALRESVHKSFAISGNLEFHFDDYLIHESCEHEMLSRVPHF